MEGYTNDTFKIMSEDIQKHFEMEMWRHKLFKVDVDTDILWNLYLDSYPEEMQSIYKENRWQDCTACRRWFRKMANVVALDDDGNMITMFSCNTLPQYQSMLDKLEEQILDKDIKEAFLSSRDEIGIPVTYTEKNGKVQRNNHFFSILPDKVIYEGVKVGQKKDELYTARQLLERSLDEISLTALDTVLDLIEDNNLYRGQQWMKKRIIGYG